MLSRAVLTVSCRGTASGARASWRRSWRRSQGLFQCQVVPLACCPVLHGRRSGGDRTAEAKPTPWHVLLGKRALSSKGEDPQPGPPEGGDEKRKQGQHERPEAMIEKSEEMVKLAMGGNIIITAAKFGAWFHSGSR